MPGDVSQAAPAAVAQEEPWTLFTDGSSCVDGSGAGLVLTNPEGVEFTYALRFQFTASNNEAEYEALVAGIRITMQMGVKNIQVLVEVLEDKSIKEKEVAAVIEEDGPTWMTQLVDYLKEGVLFGDNKKARKLRLKARQYELMEGVLYRRSFLTPSLRCVGPLQADYVMREIHEGSCSPFPEGPGKVKFLIVSMDYFTKWVEAKAVETITGGQELRLNLNLLEERREHAAVCEARAKSKMMKYYNARVRGVAFKPGDFVYRSNDASHVVAGGKLGLKWEGPYEVTEALGNGAYKLRCSDGTVLPRT
nr:hypothetical protein [Tanacetum cinerariifolium]